MKQVLPLLACLMLLFPSPAAAAPVELRVAHANAPAEDSMYHVAALYFKAQLEKHSNGEMTAAVFPSGQLGGEEELVAFNKDGTIDVVLASLNQVSNHAPGLEALFLPYMFDNTEQILKAVDGTRDYYNQYLGKRANMRLLSVIFQGYRQLMTLKPVKDLPELRTLKIRVPSNPVMLDSFKAFGVTPTPIPWGELFNALQTGVVDGFECDVSVLVSARYNEVVKYITDINYLAQLSLMTMSASRYAALSDAQKKAVDLAAADTNAFMAVKSVELLDHCIKVSTKVTFLGKPTDYPQWVEKGRSVWPALYKRIGDGDEAAGKALIERVQAAAR